MAGYRQCLLERKNVQQRVWIPSEYAVEGRYLKIRAGAKQIGNGGVVEVEPAGEWEDGWKVQEAGKVTVSQDHLNNQRAARKELAGKLEGH